MIVAAAADRDPDQDLGGEEEVEQLRRDQPGDHRQQAAGERGDTAPPMNTVLDSSTSTRGSGPALVVADARMHQAEVAATRTSAPAVTTTRAAAAT